MAAERWDCIFVDRIDATGRIYITTPQQYGYMYIKTDFTPDEIVKVRKSIPKECGIIKGSSNENKVLIATAMSIALNHNRIVASNGLIIRGFIGGMTAIFHRPDETPSGEHKWVQKKRKIGTTGWLIYISPKLELYYVNEDNRSLGERLQIEYEEKVNDCIKHLLESWQQ